MQVNLDPKKRFDTRKYIRYAEKFGEALVPLACACIFGFIVYAFAYRVLWKKVHPKDSTAGIVLLVFFLVLLAYTGVSWLAIHLYGPGVINAEYIKSTDDDPFECDEQGYAFWCSTCERIKPNRAHHSSKTDTCVPMMDHFCVWLGTVIGQGNRKFFILFLVSALALDIYVLVCLFIFQHRRYPDTIAVSIVLYIIAGFWGAFIAAVTFQHIRFIITCQTTLDSLSRRFKHQYHVNFPMEDGTRRVALLSDKADLVPGPFDRGVWNNIYDVMGPVWTWLIPIRKPIYEPQFNPKVVPKLRAQIRREQDEYFNQMSKSEEHHSDRSNPI